jgi:hypothetical protein
MTENQEADPGPLRAPEPRPIAQVQVVTAPGGMPATVIVDGVDMSRHIDRIVLDASSETIPRIVLSARADFAFEGAAIVQVMREVAAPWHEQARAWLAGLDWRQVQKQVAEGTMAQSLGDTTREVLLRQLAREEASWRT